MTTHTITNSDGVAIGRIVVQTSFGTSYRAEVFPSLRTSGTFRTFDCATRGALFIREMA